MAKEMVDEMRREKGGRVLQGVKCAALLALLGVSSMLGAYETPVQTVSVPVVYEKLDESLLAAQTVQETRRQLALERKEAIALLDEVAENPHGDVESARSALKKKEEIAGQTACEASIEAALMHMGVQAAAICGEDVLAVFVTAQDAQDEKKRVQILDLASGLSGMPAQSIKIILGKNE